MKSEEHPCMDDKKKPGLSVVAEAVTVTVKTDARHAPKTLLKDISLRIKPGEFICVLGPSGAGKSTLVRAMLGEGAIAAGRLLVGGHDVSSKGDLLRGEIGYVPQRDINPTTLPVNRALHFASQVRLPADSTPTQRLGAIDRALNNVGLTAVRKTTIGRLSGGEAKRASLAAELLADPGLLVVDEATSSLDPATEARIMMLLADQAKAGTTVITVTHHLDNVDQADKLLILGHGELVWFGSRVEALSHFDVHQLADVYLAIEDKPVGYWGTRWRERQEEDRKLAMAGTQNDAEPQSRAGDSAGARTTQRSPCRPGSTLRRICGLRSRGATHQLQATRGRAGGSAGSSPPADLSMRCARSGAAGSDDGDGGVQPARVSGRQRFPPAQRTAHGRCVCSRHHHGCLPL